MSRNDLTRRMLACLLPVVAVGCADGAAPPRTLTSDPETRPNVLVIVADDLGYSDIGPFGGEIATPNLSRLAQDGVRLTHLRSAPSCSPSRAMMLSGSDSHIAGLGAMAEATPPHYRGQEGFEGAISVRVATLAERFADAGYRTVMAGKWHLGMADGDRPAQRGFDTSFALLQGAANHFGDGGFGGERADLGGATYVENDREWEPGPDFYSSDSFTQNLIGQIADGPTNKPFFAYLAFTAPHSPLQAPRQDIARYETRYREGWGALARSGMQAAGVLDPEFSTAAKAAIAALDDQWDALSADERAVEARRMAVYAAMVDRMDRNIGVLFDSLESQGLREDTIVLFLSDNGPAGEDPRVYAVMPGFSEQYDNADNTVEGMGSSASFVLQDPRWASAIAAPARFFKGFVTDGGIRIPAILDAPGLGRGAVNNVTGDLRDVAPTLLSLAGIAQSRTVDGRQVAEIEGIDLTPMLADPAVDRAAADAVFGFNGQGLVRRGNWKAIRILPPFGDARWHLYDTQVDPAEKTDLRDREPELFAQMMAAWQAYVLRHGIDEEADLAPRVLPPAANHKVSSAEGDAP